MSSSGSQPSPLLALRSGAAIPISSVTGGGVKNQPMGSRNPRDRARISSALNWRMRPPANAWIVAKGQRRVRYRGVQANRLGLSTRAAVINLRRLLSLGLHYDNGWALSQ